MEYPREAITVALVGIVVGALGWGTAFGIQWVIDRRFSPGQLALFALGVGVVSLLRTLLAVLRRILQLKIVRRIERAQMARFVTGVLNLDPSQLRKHSAASLHQRLQGLETLRQALEDRLLGVIFDGILVIAAMGFLVSHSLRLTGLAASGALLPAMVVYYVRGSIKISFEETQKQRASGAGVCLDAFEGLAELRLCGGERWIQARLVKRYAEAQDSRLHHLVRLAIIGNTTGMISSLTSIGVLYLGALEVESGRLTPGQFMFVFTMAGMMLGPLENLVVSWIFFDDAVIALDRAEEVVSLKAVGRPHAKHTPEIKGEIRLENVGYGYDEGRPVLQGINVRLSPGSSLAIVGESGAGKSTLLSIVAGLLKPTEGRVLVDGHDLCEIDFDVWRKHLGTVFQNPHLFEGSVLENVLLGVEPVKSGVLREALNTAHIGAFVRGLSEAENSRILSGGRGLSMGQIQRLALARALARDPKVLLLDEATSNLDAHTEAAIWNALETGARRRTIIFVTHRLASSAMADQLLVLQGGRAAEMGSYQDLMSQRGHYYKLWQRQMSSPLCDEPQGSSI